MNPSLDPQLARAITSRPEGTAMAAISRVVSEAASRRTIQRRLEEWVRLGWILRHGQGRGTRYQLTAAGQEALQPEPPRWPSPVLREGGDEPDSVIAKALPPLPVEESPPPPPSMVPHPVLSPESCEARDIVRQPQAFRKAVGYRREFLDAYQPGSTFYLPENLRTHLRSIGQSANMAALPPGTYARQVLDRLLIDLSWNSSRLEGNTYSLLETDHLIQRGGTQDPARWVDAQMILNHKAAIEFLVESPGELGFNNYTFLNLHAILTENLLKDRSAEGRLRLGAVGIGGSVFHPLNNPAVLEECFGIILAKTAAIPDPLEQCFFLMVHLPYLQPFEDGNKRTSRLAANLPLIQQNLSPLSFVDVTTRDYADGILAVYELNRIEVLRDLFAWAYERSAWRYTTVRQEIGAPDPMSVRYRDEIKQCVRDTVVHRCNKPAAIHALREWAAQNVTAGDRPRFIEMVEQQLLGLRETNIARMRLRPSEFAAWLPVWQGQGGR